MLIVTGTKRSGTSMWMQVLKAAGYEIHGDAFPRDWAETIRDANREGFYESSLRHGIYYRTNPNPRTGRYLAPEATARTAVKVFAPGLVRSDLAYINKVLATMRDFREYERSIDRLYAMEHENKRRKAAARGHSLDGMPPLERMPARLEWWQENYGIIRDGLTRKYPLRMVSYASVLRDPQRNVQDALDWLGGGDSAAGVAAVRESLRTQLVDRPEPAPSAFSPALERVFDELYACIDERRPLAPAFLKQLHETQRQLAPEIKRAEQRVRDSRRRLRSQRGKQRDQTQVSARLS